MNPRDILFPGGVPVGTPGSQPSIREVAGGIQEADQMFNDLTLGGVPVAVPGYPGQLVDLPGSGRVGLRPVSKSGPPTIDVDIPGIPIKKVKFS